MLLGIIVCDKHTLNLKIISGQGGTISILGARVSQGFPQCGETCDWYFPGGEAGNYFSEWGPEVLAPKGYKESKFKQFLYLLSVRISPFHMSSFLQNQSNTHRLLLWKRNASHYDFVLSSSEHFGAKCACDSLLTLNGVGEFNLQLLPGYIQ